jgi:DNA relaxase NicK
MTIDYRIDYFRITVHKPLLACLELYKLCFEFALGNLTDLKHGAKGYKNVMGGLLGFQLKHDPINDNEYCTFEFPGQVCGSISPEQFTEFFYLTQVREYRTNINRIDFAFDNVPFTPNQFYQAFKLDESLKEKEKIIRTNTQRENLTLISSEKMREDGSGKGQITCNFGNRSSQRFLRVYNKRGPTRLELELKEERANSIANDLFSKSIEKWYEVAISHLRDFIDIDLTWWKEFINNTDRAYMKLNYAKDISIEKSRKWLLEQVSPTLAALSECTGGKIILEMDCEGRKRMYKKYKTLLSAKSGNTTDKK